MRSVSPVAVALDLPCTVLWFHTIQYNLSASDPQELIDKTLLFNVKLIRVDPKGRLGRE